VTTEAVGADDSLEALRARARELESKLIAKDVMLLEQGRELASLRKEYATLRASYNALMEKIRLIERRITIAKAERIDAAQLRLELAETNAELAKITDRLQDAERDLLDNRGEDQGAEGAPPNGSSPRKPRGGGGRRDLDECDFEKVVIELPVGELPEGTRVVGYDELKQVGHRRGGPVCVVTRTPKLARDTPNGTEVWPAVTTKSLLSRCLLAPSMLAHIVVSKYGYGLPLFRIEQRFAAEGLRLARGSMSRYCEDIGASLGAVVLAMRGHALASAVCLSTDATGVAIQPARLETREKQRQPCRKGHFFVVLADRDHVFFEYEPKHTSDAVCAMFRGYSGIIQADAHTIYDALFRGEAVPEGASPPTEVACWAHARRYFWEAAIGHHPAGKEGLLRIHAIFEQDNKGANLPPTKRTELRRRIVAPLVDAFFAWVATASLTHTNRGSVSAALGYATRQKLALRRFLDDGRIAMTNNASERALRSIATGRKAWLFCGSDDHATAAANLFSLIASCRLHDLEPEAYLRDLIRVMPYWPRARYLELSPLHWCATRAALDPTELAAENGPIAVPPPPKK
jgi:transposase